MKLTMLGTGHALVTECYNTCFLIEDNGKLFMTDCGGGNTILRQIKLAGYDFKDIHNIFITHKHVDHLLGVIWMVRMICHSMRHGEYNGDAYIYSHGEVLNLIRDISGKLLLPEEIKFIDKRLHLIEVFDGNSLEIIGHKFTFFDIQSSKAKQFGFCMEFDNKKLTCGGDEPFLISRPALKKYAEKSDWLLHEAFCLYSQADIFEPYEKHHSTVKDACELAERLGVKNLILYHTEDKNLAKRRELYREEGLRYFKGSLFIPNDLETIEL